MEGGKLNSLYPSNHWLLSLEGRGEAVAYLQWSLDEERGTSGYKYNLLTVYQILKLFFNLFSKILFLRKL